mgnify:CR=1 FL=1
MNILVCDDDHAIVDAIEIYLSQEGYKVLKAYDGLEAIKMLQEHEIHLILIDIMMPKMDGMRATMKIRETSGVPIIFLSAKSEDVDKILGLNIGADDYMTKPFSPSELVARVKAHINRYESLTEKSSEKTAKNETIEIGDLKIDRTARRVFVRGEEKNLTSKEFDLLYFLAKNPNHVFPKEELFQQIWDVGPIGENGMVGDIATVTVHIKKIREKIEQDTSNPEYIETIWGVGYRFRAN